MEEVLQHTLRICRCNAAMMSADTNMNSSLCFDDASREHQDLGHARGAA